MPDLPAAPLAVLATLAVTAPTLLAWNVAPSSTFLNQALAVALWGAFVIAMAGLPGAPAGPARPLGPALRAAWPLWAGLAVLAGAAAASCLAGSLPASLALSALVLLAAAAVALLGGLAAPPQAFAALCVGLALAGLANVSIALVQVFAPQWADGDWIARSALAGRAVGNLRQPNHVASLLLWSSIALVALVELGRLRPRWAWPALALLMWAVVLTASRTGMVGAVLLALWALADRRLSRAGRALALSAPAWYALAWVGMAEWARQAHQAFGGAARLGESVEGSSRMGIWRDTLALIGEHPWWGVGFGEFNFAWSLTPFPNRPVAFFDHTHNLVLQFAVELGLPLTALLMALLAWALWRAARRAWGAGNARRVLAPGAPRAAPASAPARMALAMVAMIGLHSLLEYPLWYAYFLLPAAWCLGAALAAPGADAWRETAARQAPPEVPQEVAPGVAHGVPRPGRAALQLGGAALVLGALGAVADYARVVPIFEAGEGAAPLAQRIAAGQHSLLFAHHAHYAAATVSATPAQELPSLQQAAHHLLDTRLMMAWARAYADAGDLERARFLAARLREFRNPASAELFEPCAAAGPGAAPATRREAVLADQPEPFACTADSGTLGWRDFLPPGDPRAASAARGR